MKPTTKNSITPRFFALFTQENSLPQRRTQKGRSPKSEKRTTLNLRRFSFVPPPIVFAWENLKRTLSQLYNCHYLGPGLSTQAPMQCSLSDDPSIVIKKRIHQIRLISRTDHRISARNISLLAQTIETSLRSPIKSSSFIYLKKRLHNTCRSLFLDFKQKQVHILLKSKNSGYVKIGSEKKCTNALSVPFDISQQPFVSVQLVYPKNFDIGQILKEIEFSRKFSSSPRIFHTMSFPGKNQKPKFSIIEERFDGDMSRVSKIPLSLAEKIKLAIKTLSGMEQIHSMGYVHGDVHEGNVLFKREASETRVTWIDLSHARKAGNVEAKAFLFEDQECASIIEAIFSDEITKSPANPVFSSVSAIIASLGTLDTSKQWTSTQARSEFERIEKALEEGR
jgi:hypothetical protein